MTQPARKSIAVEDALTNLLGQDRRVSIQANRCLDPPFGCGQPVDFTIMTPVERQEYPISGLCGPCQRVAFAPPPHEADIGTVSSPNGRHQRHVARCTCGWESEEYADYSSAEQAADQHEEDEEGDE